MEIRKKIEIFLGPYVIGILYGYLMFLCKQKKTFKIPKVIN
jgi:hypothetical protein